MINIKVKRAFGYTSVEIEGHAAFAPHGRDIVCAGVSAIIHAAILGLKDIAEEYPENVTIKIEDHD